MTTTYAILATVTLQHDYYADGRSNDFEIIPSAATAAALKGAAILTRTIGNVLVLLVKVDEDGATYIDLPSDLKLTFYMRLSSPAFINITNIPYEPGSVFYFTNLHRTEVGGTRYLNRRVPAFSNATAYAIGDMAEDGGSIFEAIKPVSPGSHATGETSFWFPRTGEQYVHGEDLLQLTDGQLRVSTAAASVFDIAVFGLNPLTLMYDIPAGPSQQQRFPQNQEAIIIPLPGLGPGKYRVAVNGQDHFVYIDAAASYARIFGIIELHNLFSAADDFGLLDAANHPKELDHIIRFANRLAIWKYITRTTQVTGIEVTAVPNAFVPGLQPKEFLSAAPMPLRQQPLKTLQLMKGATVLASRLANPPPDRISTCEDGSGNTYFCAEMYLNY
jgi:hypothetical protein